MLGVLLVTFFFNFVFTDEKLFTEAKEIDYRLPNTTKPLEYDLELVTFLDEEFDKQFYFEGTVTIKISVNTKTPSIILHSKCLKIKDIELKNDANNYVKLLTPQYENKTNFLIVTSAEDALKIGHYTLKINYEGTLRTEKRGFYRDSYKNENNEIR